MTIRFILRGCPRCGGSLALEDVSCRGEETWLCLACSRRYTRR